MNETKSEDHTMFNTGWFKYCPKCGRRLRRDATYVGFVEIPEDEE